MTLLLKKGMWQTSFEKQHTSAFAVGENEVGVSTGWYHWTLHTLRYSLLFHAQPRPFTTFSFRKRFVFPFFQERYRFNERLLVRLSRLESLVSNRRRSVHRKNDDDMTTIAVISFIVDTTAALKVDHVVNLVLAGFILLLHSECFSPSSMVWQPREYFIFSRSRCFTGGAL